MRNSRLKYQWGWGLIASPTGKKKNVLQNYMCLKWIGTNGPCETRWDAKALVWKSETESYKIVNSEMGFNMWDQITAVKTKSEALEPYPSCFLKHEVVGSISSPPGQDASPSQVISPKFVTLLKQFASTHLYYWVGRGTVRVKCLAQEHNTMSLARAWTQTTRLIRDKCTNHQNWGNT